MKLNLGQNVNPECYMYFRHISLQHQAQDVDPGIVTYKHVQPPPPPLLVEWETRTTYVSVLYPFLCICRKKPRVCDRQVWMGNGFYRWIQEENALKLSHGCNYYVVFSKTHSSEKRFFHHIFHRVPSAQIRKCGAQSRSTPRVGATVPLKNLKD